MHSFQLIEAITVRDFNGRGIILIQLLYLFVSIVFGATNTREKCSM